MTVESLPQTAEPTEHGRKLALLRAIGLDKASPDQRELALNIAQRYELDLLMKHLVLIDGRPYITRDGLLHVAHRSNQLDGITTSEPVVVDEFWRATASVYRKDMSHPFTYTGRYPTKGGNAKFAPEMAVKVAEVMALRRAFDVAAPTAEERWDAELPAEPPAPAPTLAERAAQVRASIHATEATAEPGAPADAADGASVSEPTAETSAPTSPAPEGEAAEGPVAGQVAAWEQDEPLPAALTRVEFLAAVKRDGFDVKVAEQKAKELFPGVLPIALSDEQRADLYAVLRTGI